MSDVDLIGYGRVLWKWLWLIGLATGVAAAGAYYTTQSIPRVYVSSTTLLVGEETARTNPDALTSSQRMASIYAAMARRQPVLEATVEALGLPMSWRGLQSRIFVLSVPGSQLVEIRVNDTDPPRGTATADEIARQLILQSPTTESLRQMEGRRQFVQRQLERLQGDIERAEALQTQKSELLRQEESAWAVMELQDEIRALDLKLTSWRASYTSLLGSTEAKSPSALTVVEPASVPGAHVYPNVRATVATAAGVALLLALAAVILIEGVVNHDRFSTLEQVAQSLHLAPLGSVPDMGRLKQPSAGLVVANVPDSPLSEAFRVLRTNIRFAWASRDASNIGILVTSPGLGDGKSTTSANLAASFARAGHRTILVDADLRNPSLHRVFDVSNDVGLTSVLAAESGAADLGGLDDAEESSQSPLDRSQVRHAVALLALVRTSVPGLSILPSGPATGVNPGELLASPAMAELLEQLRGMADVVIVDGPPVLPVADTAILSALGLGIVVVADVRRTRGQVAREAKDTLARADAQLLGIVLNRIRESHQYAGYGQKSGESTWRAPILRILPR